MKKEFLPVLRFVVCSDAHIEGIGAPGYYRLKHVIDYALDFASKDNNYNKIDSFFIAGDITNRGTKEEFEAFKEALRLRCSKGCKFPLYRCKGTRFHSNGKEIS